MTAFPRPSAPGVDWWDDSPPGLPGTQTTKDICGCVLDAAVSRLKCLLASVWSVDPVNQELVLVDVRGFPRDRVAPTVIRCESSMSGTAVERIVPSSAASASAPRRGTVSARKRCPPP